MTMGETSVLVLTDDEILAVGIRLGRPWPTLLPTVDLGDDAGVLEAFRRGIRSLIARRLMTENEDRTVDGRLTRLVADVAGSPLWWGTYLCDADLLLVRQEMTVSQFHKSADRWVTEVTTEAGLHYLQYSDTKDCLKATSALHDEGFAGRPLSPAGADGADDGLSVCTAGYRDAHAAMAVTTRRDEVWVHRFHSDGARDGAPEPRGSVGEALHDLLALG